MEKEKFFTENFQLIYIERMIETENYHCHHGGWPRKKLAMDTKFCLEIWWGIRYSLEYLSQNITNQLQRNGDFTVEKHDWQKATSDNWRRYL